MRKHMNGRFCQASCLQEDFHWSWFLHYVVGEHYWHHLILPIFPLINCVLVFQIIKTMNCILRSETEVSSTSSYVCPLLGENPRKIFNYLLEDLDWEPWGYPTIILKDPKGSCDNSQYPATGDPWRPCNDPWILKDPATIFDDTAAIIKAPR